MGEDKDRYKRARNLLILAMIPTLWITIQTQDYFIAGWIYLGMGVLSIFFNLFWDKI